MVRPRGPRGLVAFAIAAWSSIQAFAEEHKVVSLSEETFAKTIQRGQRALVAFVTPWCLACRLLMAELEKLHEALQPQVLVAQCDVSKETGLANLYSAWRTPLVVLFPDTEVLLPGLQVIYAGQMHYSSLLSFANAGPWPPQLRSPLDLEEVVRESGRAGTFVGFFRSPEAAGHLQDLWPLDCLRRHNRAFTFARWANETDRNQSRGEEELWRWAGLGARKALRIKEVQEGQLLKQEIELDSNTGSADLSPVEAVVYVRADEDACQFAPSDKYVMYQEGGSSSSSARISPSSWRERVDAFCAWCERQVLGPVAVFDAPRAAALDGTFDWLLLLFAPKDVTEDQEGESGFLRERRRLERFTSAACAKDRRYGEVLPVIVPWGGEDILAFRASFGLGPQDPALPLPRQGEGGDLRTGCHALQDADNEDTEPGRRRRLVLFATSLFNTRTRRKYPAPGGAGWCPGDELALCLFTDAVLDGKVLPQIRSTKRFPEPDVASPRVKELFGSSVEVEVLQAVAQRRAEVLMLVYAPFCSHSLHFFALWRQVSDAMHAMTGPSLNASAPVLQMAQMDGMQNEHPELPPIRQFPTLLLCLPKETGAADVLSSSVVFKQYQGPGNLAAILSWISRNSAVAPRVVGVEGLS